MTIANDSISTGPYVGNGVAAGFAYDFRILDEDQIVVVETDVDGNATQLVLDSDFTVSGVGDGAGGTITRLAGGLPTGYEWVIYRLSDIDQQTDFIGQGDFNPRIHEDALDLLTMIAQELQGSVTRSIRAPRSELSIDWEMPVASVRAGKYIRFSDITGQPEVADILPSATVLSASVIGSYLYPVDAFEMSAALDVKQIHYPYGVPQRYAETAETDFTVALQAAADYWREINGNSDTSMSTLDLQGMQWAISDTVNISGRGIQVFNGGLVPTAGSTWTGDHTQPMLQLNQRNCGVERLYIDGSYKASCLKLANGSGQRISNNSIFRFRGHGVHLPTGSAGDSLLYGNVIFEVPNGDPEFVDPSAYLSIGLYVDNADCNFIGNIVKWSLINVYLTANAGTLQWTHNHFFNGKSTAGAELAISAISQANPGVITTADNTHTPALAVGDPVFIENVSGMTEINNSPTALFPQYYVNSILSSTQITLKDAGGTPVDTSGFSAYTSGGSLSWSKFEHTKNLVIEAGAGAAFANTYLDNGENDIYARTIHFVNTTVIGSPDRAVNTYVIKFLANQANDDMQETYLQGFRLTSNSMKSSVVPIITFDANGFSWAADYTHLPALLAEQQELFYVSDGVLQIADGVARTALTLFNPAAIDSLGARIHLVDKITTDPIAEPPLLRSSGDDIVVKGAEVKLDSYQGGGLRVYGTTTSRHIIGAGSPEGAITAPVGSIFQRTDGGASSTFYVKESGAGNTGWVAK